MASGPVSGHSLYSKLSGASQEGIISGQCGRGWTGPIS